MALTGADGLAIVSRGFENNVVIGGPGVPAVPTGLAALIISSASIKMGWDFGANAEKYTLRRATISGGPYTDLSTTIAALFFLDSPVAKGTDFFYQVLAENGDGSSAFSAEVKVTSYDLDAIPATTPAGDILSAIQAKMREIDTVQTDSVIVGSEEGLEQKPADFFPAVEIYVDDDAGIEFDSQRLMTLDYSFTIWAYTFSATPDRLTGADMLVLNNFAAAVIRKIYSFHDDSTPPTPGFLFVNPNYTKKPRYNIFDTGLNTAIIEVSLKVDAQDIEI